MTLNMPLTLLEDRASSKPLALNHEDIIYKLTSLFKDFSLAVSFHYFQEGPSITRYNFGASPNINLSKLQEIEANIALCLAVPSVRVLAPVPSQPYIGIEVPNKERLFVSLHEILSGKNSDNGKIFEASKIMELPIILGKEVTGKIIVTDLARLPHLLIAGATGSGKSICVNSIIASLLYLRNNIRFAMVDPKIVELKVYEGIPQLITNVVTNPSEAITLLKYLTNIMHKRYKKLEEAKVRNLKSYNEVSGKRLPYIIAIIDEFADLVATHKKQLEQHLATLSAMARATGIHLVLATQRPSVDVITGVIKSNFPSRIAFRVPSNVDSRVILDSSGAESLLGKGDMLYREPQFDCPMRIQGIYISDTEVHNILSHLTANGRTSYKPLNLTEGKSSAQNNNPLVLKAKEILSTTNNRTTAYLQRRLVVSWDTASDIISTLRSTCPNLFK